MSIEEQLNEMRQNVANSYVKVKSKGGTLPQDRNLANLPDAIDSISGGSLNLQDKTVTPSSNVQIVTADAGYDGLSRVRVNVIPINYQDITGTDANTSQVLDGATFASETAGGIATGTMQRYTGSITVTPSASKQILATAGTYVAGNIIIEAIPPSTELYTKQYVSAKPNTYIDPTTWIAVNNWNNIAYIGSQVWSDGADYYISSGSNQYKYDASTDTWTTITWTGLAAPYGNCIWHQGTHTYYSEGTLQYELDIANMTWTAKTWNGLTDFNGYNIWFDGTNTYYTENSVTYKLDTSTDTWSSFAWENNNPADGQDIWSDGVNLFHCVYANHFWKLNSTKTDWENVPFLQTFDGRDCWSDGVKFYWSSASKWSFNRIIDIKNKTANSNAWTGLTRFNGQSVFTMFGKIYYSAATGTTYELQKNIITTKTV